jgi:putative transposase
MPYRKIIFTPDNYYHLINRGVGKKLLFRDKRDYSRFLFLILYLQYSKTPQNISRHITHYVKHRVFNIKENKDTLGERLVELVAFTIMPNHFHLIIKELGDANISDYMQRVLDAYAKYFNTKYKTVGHLFEGPFRAIHAVENYHILYLSAYLHRNPRDIPKWKNREHRYPWSSYQDYLGNNRWGKLLATNVILNEFKNSTEYKNYVESSGAKEIALDSHEFPQKC